MGFKLQRRERKLKTKKSLEKIDLSLRSFFVLFPGPPLFPPSSLNTKIHTKQRRKKILSFASCHDIVTVHADLLSCRVPHKVTLVPIHY